MRSLGRSLISSMRSPKRSGSPHEHQPRGTPANPELSLGNQESWPMKQRQLFQLLSEGLEITIRNANPWWRAEPIAEVPAFHRWAFEPVYTRLTRGLAPAIVLRGPRQIGKTTLLNQIVD